MNDNDDTTPNVIFDAFIDLQWLYEFGDKAALYDAVARSGEPDGMALPAWAAEALKELVIEKWKSRHNKWKGHRLPKGVGYKAFLAMYIRAEVYRSAMNWVKNKRHYKKLPTRCIQAWYDGEFDSLPTKKSVAAQQVALVGLQGTPAANTSLSTLEQHSSFDAPKKVNPSDFANDELAEIHDMTLEQYSEYMAAVYVEGQRLPLSFGYRESEVFLGLRPSGQFWGPPCDPPKHIKEILSKEPPLINQVVSREVV